MAIGGASHNLQWCPQTPGGTAMLACAFDDVTMPMKMPYGPQQDNHYDCGLFVASTPTSS